MLRFNKEITDEIMNEVQYQKISTIRHGATMLYFGVYFFNTLHHVLNF